MEATAIRLLIVDDNLEACDILENYFALTDEVSVCGVAHNGGDALFQIEKNQPDVVLLDLIMPPPDGLTVLEKLNTNQFGVRPRVIVTSAVGQEDFTSDALAKGADYYMIKPYDLADLFSRVCVVAHISPKRDKPQRAPAVDAADPQIVVARTLLEMGMPAHMLGYRYSTSAVLLLLRQNRPQAIVKDVYAHVAREYDTTPECVEGAIRKVVRRAFEKQPQAVAALTGGNGCKPPTNGQFLVMLTQRLWLKLGTHEREENAHAAPSCIV